MADADTANLIGLLDRLADIEKYLADESEAPGAETFGEDIAEYVENLQAALRPDTR